MGTYVIPNKNPCWKRLCGTKKEGELFKLSHVLHKKGITDIAGFKIPEDIKFLMVENNNQIGSEHKFSQEKLTTVMSLYSFDDFTHALDLVKKIYSTAGKGIHVVSILIEKISMH